MKPFHWTLIVTCFSVAGYVVGTARADGAPTTQPLFYAGTIEEAGALAEGQVPIGLALFSDETLGDPDTKLCDIDSVNRDVVRGRFRVDVSACRSAVADNADAFVEVTVRGVPLPRQKLGAVPYALEADRAQVAAVAEAVAAGAVDAAAIAVGAAGSSLLLREVRSGSCAVDAASAALGFTVTDCVCSANEQVVSGGAVIVPGGSIRESRPSGTRAWRVACSDAAGADTTCTDAFALCMRASP